VFLNQRKTMTTETRLPTSVFDSDRVDARDPETTRRAHDAEVMDAILNGLVSCELSKADVDLVHNPFICRLLQILDVVLDYIVPSSVELSSHDGSAILESTHLRISLSRAKEKFGAISVEVSDFRGPSKCAFAAAPCVPTWVSIPISTVIIPSSQVPGNGVAAL
jgi:hypothetical protein